MIALLAGCTESGDTSSGSNDTEPDIKILDHELTSGSTGLATVEGTVKNVSGAEQNYIEVTATLFDDEGTRLGEGLDNASDVPAGQDVRFECMTSVEASDVENYEVDASTSL
jgi:hypothetical protein